MLARVEDVVVTVAVGVAVFAATNVDDLLVLVAFLADPAYRTRHVVVGQVAGIGLLVAVSAACALLALVVPDEWIGLTGLAALGLGLSALWRLVRGGQEEGAPPAPAPSRTQALAVGVVTVANGGDNVAVYTPLFATSSGADVALLAAVFLAMTALAIAGARALVRHPALGGVIRRGGRVALPLVLIGLGVLIPLEAGSWRLLT
jgi:cadmium resistance protein CadD (predicted permease)